MRNNVPTCINRPRPEIKKFIDLGLANLKKLENMSTWWDDWPDWIFGDNMTVPVLTTR